MRTKVFLIGSVALLFGSFLYAQNLPQIPVTKASWEFSANYGGGMRAFQAVQGSTATQNLPNRLGIGMISYQVVFANKWLIAAEAGFLGDHNNKRSWRNNQSFQQEPNNINLSQGSLIGGYNLLQGEKFRLFGTAGIGGGSVALNPNIYGSGNNLGRTSYSSFQVGLMGQYIVKLGKLRNYNAYRGRNCCCCCKDQTTAPQTEETTPKRYVQWIMPISFSLTFHKARTNDSNTNNNLVTSLTNTEAFDPALAQTAVSADSYYKNFSGVSFSIFVGFGAQRRNTIAD